MKIALACDHRGAHLYEPVRRFLEREGHELVATATSRGEECDYPDLAWAVGRAVADGAADRGILICGWGTGMNIAANKIHGVRAALCHDLFGAERSRRHMDANVLCLAAELMGQEPLKRVLLKWLACDFEGGRHDRRVRKIMAIESGRDPATIDL